MIYFDMQTRNKLVEKFYGIIEKNGYLLVGHSEALAAGSVKFKNVAPAAYRK
jgi:chemotaxis protein methyltransferase CheR